MKHQHQHGYWTRHEHVNTYNIQNIEHSMGIVSVSDTDTDADACRTRQGVGVSVLHRTGTYVWWMNNDGEIRASD